MLCMSLASITVENYRAFRQRATFELRPFTLLFGYNSAGKSALSRLPKLLADSVLPRAPGDDGPLSLQSPAARGASFRDLVNRESDELKLALRFAKDPQHPNLPTHIDLDLRLHQRGRIEQHQIIGLRTRGDTEAAMLELQWIPERTPDGSVGWRYDVIAPPDLPAQPILLGGLLPARNWLPTRQLVGPLGGYADQLRSLEDRVLWLDATRAPAPRRVSVAQQPLDQLAANGSGAAEWLVWERLTGAGELTKAVTDFYLDQLEHHLDIETFGDQHALVLAPRGAPTARINLADTGEGMAQVLPVLVQSERSRAIARHKGWCLQILEHPELHLQPKLHVPLAEYLCRLAAGPAAPLTVIETHSELMLLQVRLALLEGWLTRDQVAVYWVRQEAGESTLVRAEFDELAMPRSGWPPDVFSAEVTMARRILRLQRKAEEP